MVLKEIKWPWHAKNDAPFSMNLGPVHCGMITQVRWIPEQALGTKFHNYITVNDISHCIAVGKPWKPDHKTLPFGDGRTRISTLR